MGADPLGEDRVAVGLSADLRCYITLEYIEQRHRIDCRFDDFLVHETAHVLHDARRERIGLRGTRTRVRLVDLEFRKRETFAYAIEAYRMIIEHAPRLADRPALVDELAKSPPGDDRRPG